jgi:hypothetical protein
MFVFNIELIDKNKSREYKNSPDKFMGGVLGFIAKFSASPVGESKI